MFLKQQASKQGEMVQNCWGLQCKSPAQSKAEIFESHMKSLKDLDIHRSARDVKHERLAWNIAFTVQHAEQGLKPE